MSIKSRQVWHFRLINNAIPLETLERAFIVITTRHLDLETTLLRSTELNTFSMTKTIYRDLP